MDNVKLAYLGFTIPCPNTYMGGLMICDDKGFPVEFRYSEPIKPTSIQQVLYGNVLEKHIKVDVISESLLKSVSSPFEIMIVQDENLLEHKFSSNITVLRISQTKSPPLTNQGENIKIKDKEFLLQASLNSHPLRVQFAASTKNDDNKFKSYLDTLAAAGQRMDLDEPLSRVYRALELICQQIQAQQKESSN